MFELHPAFPPTSEAVGDLALCHVRLQADARFPWLVLIPRIAGAREVEDLPANDRAALMEEIVRGGGAVRAIGEALGRPVAKLNVGALGNVTPQLHVHIVGRRSDDAAWPGPVWGAGTVEAYGPDDVGTAIAAARRALDL
ncbi:MAG: HIT domain-containing protein [Phenylobacterium sp.]|uniref:HIT domain-containing protein n=1 Tax=Phenylobacterium sp. TaxID=1871053 RepID=UPI001A4B2632|nr:HIT domain-containing protein [Phenylobacterium sp.]MBL8554443.1 HIT domain-containing protein [Phenylobacterium sp.]